MAAYGILRVRRDWDETDVVYFHESAYLRYNDDLEEGTRALIFAEDGIIGEIEVTQDFSDVNPDTDYDVTDPLPPEEREPENPMEDRLDWDEGVVFRTPDRNVNRRAYPLPMRVVRSTVETRPIPADVVRNILDDLFIDEEIWIAIDERIYRALVGEWEKEAS